MIQTRLLQLRQQLPTGVRLCVVSKRHPAEAIQKAYDAGQRIFGENQVQELMQKVDLLPGDIEWHMIGTLQRNKVKYIAPFISMVQSVDSLPLYEELLKRATQHERRIDFLLQVHIAQEDSKAGIPREQLNEIAQVLAQRPEDRAYMRPRGLMGIATLTEDSREVEQEFAYLKSAFEELRLGLFSQEEAFDTLSMGMSQDWPLAVSLGANLIRVGSAIMGDRQY